jgi:chitinase
VSVTNVRFTNNRLLRNPPNSQGCWAKSGYYGPTNIWMNSTVNVVAGNVWDDDGSPITVSLPAFTPAEMAVGDATVVEGDAGARYLTFPVTLSKRSTVTVTASYTVTTGVTSSATAASDYTAKSGTLTFARSAATGYTPTLKYVRIPVKTDTTVEPDEQVRFELSNPTNATLVRPTGTGTILNDDATSALRVSIGSVRINEGDDGAARTATVSISLNRPAPAKVTVVAFVTNGSALGGSDFYVKPPTTVTFLAGQVKKSLTVRVKPDVLLEANETLNVGLSSPSAGVALYRSSGTITIGNDD